MLNPVCAPCSKLSVTYLIKSTYCLGSKLIVQLSTLTYISGYPKSPAPKSGCFFIYTSAHMYILIYSVFTYLSHSNHAVNCYRPTASSGLEIHALRLPLLPTRIAVAAIAWGSLCSLAHCGHIIYSALLLFILVYILVCILPHAYSEFTIRVFVSHSLRYIANLLVTVLTVETTIFVYRGYKLSGMVMSFVEAIELLLILPIQPFYFVLIFSRFVFSVFVLLLQLFVVLIISLPYELESFIQLSSMLLSSGLILEAAVLHKVVIGIGILVLAQCFMPLLLGGLPLLFLFFHIELGCKLTQP